MEAKLLRITDELHLYCQANAYFAQTLRQAFRESILNREHIKMNGAYDVSNLEACKDLAVLSRLTVSNSRKSESNMCVKKGQKMS